MIQKEKALPSCSQATETPCSAVKGLSDGIGLGSLGAIVAKIEMSGELDMPDVSFLPDDIDKIIDDFRHTVAAVG